MAEISTRKRIWGWMFFDWAQQPYATLGLTFIFGPYFGAVAADWYMAQGIEETAAKAQAQSLWAGAQTAAGWVIAITAPLVGAWAGASGRKRPFFIVLTAIAILCSALLWNLQPDGTGLMFVLAMFWIGFVASETAFNLNNAILPTLGSTEEVGRISGGAAAFGYWGGVLALFIMLLFFAENDTGKTLIGLTPALGLDPEAREGTRSVGPFIAIWFALFLIPFFIWTKDPPTDGDRPQFGEVLSRLWERVKDVFTRRSYASFLIASMFYRDGLGALYSFGGFYARLVLGWDIIQIGIFGIVAAIAAAVLTWAGGLADQRFGPKPVIRLSCWVLIVVSLIIVGMSRESLFGIPLAEGSSLPDIIFFICGAILGGAGGIIYSASRSMMVRHCTAEDATEAFGLFALTGRVTSFLAPALITVFTIWTGNNQLGFLPVIFLFLLGLILLLWVNPEGDRAE